jgi:hypothetical protein
LGDVRAVDSRCIGRAPLPTELVSPLAKGTLLSHKAAFKACPLKNFKNPKEKSKNGDF